MEAYDTDVAQAVQKSAQLLPAQAMPSAVKHPSALAILWLRLRAKWRLIWLALRAYRRPAKAVNVLKKFALFQKGIAGAKGKRKVAFLDGKGWFGFYMPPFPSANFDRFILTLFNGIEPHHLPVNRHQLVNFAITTHCPLRCRHCYEWDNLNKPETFDLATLKQITGQLVQEGTGHLVLTGGEPMTRFNDMLELLKLGDRATEWCVFTSGYRLTLQKARQLKAAGAVSVSVSLDHYNREAHNDFRGHAHAYDYAINALINCREAGLLTAMSLCFTRATANKAFIGRYMELARRLGVGFVQWLEPLPQGHYSGQDVLLSKEQIALLEEQYLAYNHQPGYAAYPGILYHGFHQRRVGCVWGGRLGIYIDTTGIVHSCPFCHSADYAVIDWLKHPVEQRGAVTGCPLFERGNYPMASPA